jgi:hypothetical protein
MVGSALAFLVVLFLDWHRTTVDIAGVTHVEASTSGWSGWGLLAGIAAIVLVALNVRRQRRGQEPDATFGIADLVLGVVIVSATVAAVFSGDADVQVAASDRRWRPGRSSGRPGSGSRSRSWTAVSAAIVALPEAWQPGSARPRRRRERGSCGTALRRPQPRPRVAVDQLAARPTTPGTSAGSPARAAARRRAARRRRA